MKMSFHSASSWRFGEWVTEPDPEMAFAWVRVSSVGGFVESALLLYSSVDKASLG